MSAAPGGTPAAATRDGAARAGSRDAWPAGVWLILVLGSVLRFLALGRQSFWFDEVQSVSRVWGSQAWSLTETAFSGRAPLYLLLLKGWIWLFGPGEVPVRTLSAILASLGLVLFYRIALGLVGRRRATFALLFLACSPFYLWYSQEATNYALLFDLGTLGVVAFLAEIERRTIASFAIALLASAAAFLGGPTGFFLYALDVVLVLVPGRRPRYPLRRLVLFGVLSALILSPWLGFSARTTGPVHLGRPSDESGVAAAKGDGPPGPASIPFTYYVFSAGNSAGPNVDDLKMLRLAAVKPHLWYLVPAGLLFTFALYRGLRRTDRSTQRVLLPWVLVPVLAMAAFAMLNLKPPNPRYAYLALSPYLLYLAAGVGSLQGLARRRAMLAAILFCLVCSDYQYFTDPYYWKPDARGAGQLLTREVRPDDAVVLYSLDYPIRHYVPPSMVILLPGAKEFADEASMERWLLAISQGRRRVWVVQYHGWWVDRGNRFVRVCGRVMHLEREWPFAKVPVYLFEKTGLAGPGPSRPAGQP